MGHAFLGVVQEALGVKFTDEVKDAYMAFYGMMAKEMKEGLNIAFLVNKDHIDQ